MDSKQRQRVAADESSQLKMEQSSFVDLTPILASISKQYTPIETNLTQACIPTLSKDIYRVLSSPTRT